MNEKKIMQMYVALKRIAAYTPPDRLHRTAEREYGLEPDEAISYAYENVIAEAKAGIKGIRIARAEAASPAAREGREA